MPSRFAGRHSALAGLLPPMLVVLMTLASLFGFNRDAWWDETALYFFGAFGLGILAWWASGQFRAGRWLALLTALAVSALVVDFRARIAVATAVMLFLGLARHFGMLHTLSYEWTMPGSLKKTTLKLSTTDSDDAPMQAYASAALVTP